MPSNTKQIIAQHSRKYASKFNWEVLLKQEREKLYFKKLELFLKQEKKKGAVIYPPEDLRYNALKLTPFDNTKVIILGQDPYHGANQAHGLSFSVPNNIATPPSLKNIFKALNNDINNISNNSLIRNNLTPWAQQGVLLLNTSLSVEANKANSHAKIGWEIFTNEIIINLNDRKENLVFLLWGKLAQEKKNLIDKSNHLILTSSHPSPLSAYRGFLNCKHFSKTNDFLANKNIKQIKWI